MERNQQLTPGMGRLPAMAPLANPYVPYQQESPARYEARQGLVRGTLYPGLDLPFMGMVNKQMLHPSAMSDLQAAAFAVQELALYLDTHREDEEALSLYRRYQQLYNEKKQEYICSHRPLCHADVTGNAKYAWLNDPWPWDNCGNKEA